MLLGMAETPPRRRLTTVFVCLGASAMLTLSGCGNLITTKIIGGTGITVSPSGDPVAVIAVCSDYVDEIDIALGREGLADDEPNVHGGIWTAAEPQSGLVQVNLVTPEPPWQGPNVVFEDDLLYIVGSYPADEDMSAGQAALTGAQMADLESGTVYVDVSDSDRLTTTPISEFLTETCERVEGNS